MTAFVDALDLAPLLGGFDASTVGPAILKVAEFIALGLGAGILTTVAGQGGGLLLLLACAMMVGPHAALAITAPALLLGNVHRSFLLRRFIDRSVALRLVAGALPGALVGGFLAGGIPAWSLQVILVGISALAVAKALGWLSFTIHRRALVPAGILLGGTTGTAGGAGVLFAPVLLSAGLTGRVYVGTSAAVAVATHIGRVAGYASLGLFTRALVGPTVAVTLAIFVGNALGDRVRTWLLYAGGPQERRAPDSPPENGTETGRAQAGLASEAYPEGRVWRSRPGGPAQARGEASHPAREGCPVQNRRVSALLWRRAGLSGLRWSRLTPEQRTKLIEYVTLVVCVVLSVAGLG